jgi:ribose-phosphate pyrophosphokinase
MTPRVFPLPGNGDLAARLARRLGADLGELTVRRFPDGESYVRFDTPPAGRSVVLVCTLDRPDEKVVPLCFAASTARELGAERVGLVAPYLAYMRQDARFQPGEGVTAPQFARLLSGVVDWLVTVDPHLHRVAALTDIYRVPATAVASAGVVAAWLRAHVRAPLVVGPDSESAQWVRAVADRADAPHVVLSKVRHGDREVEVSVPDVDRWRTHTPVLVDDIISTASTMIETVGHLRQTGLGAPVCVGVHAVFAGHAYRDLLAMGPARVATCDTIPHASNAIALDGPIAEHVRPLLEPHWRP